MAKVLVMTDTVAGIPKDLAEEYQITVVPAANIMFNGQVYTEGVTIDATQAYELIKKDPDRFVTSAATPGQLLEAYREVSKKSQEILFITIASALSALFRTANVAMELFREESPQTTIRTFDSRTCAGAQGLVVLAAARAAAQGMSLEQVASVAEQTRQKTRGLMMLDTLRYVYRTGRMSKLASRLASLLNIKPINRMTEAGTLEFVDKVRKREDGVERLLNLIREEAAGAEGLHFMLMHAADPQFAEEFSERLKKEFNCLSMVISEYSPVMGYGSGPGALFVGFHPELDFLK